jgi:hypothetical protein
LEETWYRDSGLGVPPPVDVYCWETLGGITKL